MGLKKKAGLHALIIGVGKYVARPNLTQPGAVMSAVRFAEWLRNEYRHPLLELGSMRVLLSPVDDEQAEAAVEVAGRLDGPARREDVEREVSTWAKAFNENQEDAAVLYLAGHGCSMVGSGGFLLLEGFGSSEDPLAHALNLNVLFEAMGTKRAHANFVFVDACRQTIEEQKKYITSPGICPLRVEVGAPRLRKILKICYGAAPDERAWTLHKDEVHQHGTIFGKSLLLALNGEALDLDPEGQLCITANRLTETTARLVGKLAASYNEEYKLSIMQAPEGIGSTADISFHVPETVTVNLQIELDPVALASVAEANLFKQLRGPRIVHDRMVPLEQQPSLVKVPSGKYQLHVQSRPPPPPAFPPKIDVHLVTPARSHWRVQIDR